MFKFIIACFIILTSCATTTVVQTIHPKTTKEFASTTVRIIGEEGGGTGVILQSKDKGTVILTNRHVCLLTAKGGGYVLYGQSKYPVFAYKPSSLHDLCFVQIKENLGINTELADEAPELYSPAHISGHPALLPDVVSHGDFSEELVIRLVVRVDPCTKEDMDKFEKEKNLEDLFMCALFGKPVIENFDSQLVTGLVLPGSSGSAVFNDDGKIEGLIFASGSRELSYGLMVPHRYLKAFIYSESLFLRWKKPKTEASTQDSKQKTQSKLLYNLPYYN